MRHLIILVALLAVAGLDFIFVTYSPTAQSALTFAVLAFLIMLLLGVAAGSRARSAVDFTVFMSPRISHGLSGFAVRLGLGTLIPLALLLAASFAPDLSGPVETVELARTLTIFWMVTALALVGVALTFFWPRTGIYEAVLVGGIIILARSLISWIKADADRELLQLALFGQMLWPSLCLLGAWVGLALREITECHLYLADGKESHDATPEPPEAMQAGYPGATPLQADTADAPAPPEIVFLPARPEDRNRSPGATK